MPSKLNQLAHGELCDAFKDVESAVFVDFTGVGSEETYALRKLLHEQNISMRVVKKSLAKLALEQLGAGVNDGALKGALALIHSSDPVAAAKVLLDHRKAFKKTKLTVKGGFLERKAIGPDEVKELSDLPSRHQLLGMVAGTFAAPITGFVNVQAGIIRKLLYAFDAIKDKKGGDAQAA